MNHLCTLLPDLPAEGTAERHFFVSALRTDWCHDGDLDDIHQSFLADGIPYTVQTRPALDPDDIPQDDDWQHPSLTAAERNPFLCRQ